MKTTVQLPPKLLRRVKTVAARRRQTLTQLVTAAIQREVTVPLSAEPSDLSTAEYVRRIEAFARANAAAWKTKKTAVQAIAEQRRCRYR